jgi:hypothetical protein
MYTEYTAGTARILPREQGAAATCTAREAAAQALVAGVHSIHSRGTSTGSAHSTWLSTPAAQAHVATSTWLSTPAAQAQHT